MKRPLRFAIVLAVALTLVPILPFYIERTFRRSWLMNPPGTLVEWGWKLCTLKSFGRITITSHVSNGPRFGSA